MKKNEPRQLRPASAQGNGDVFPVSHNTTGMLRASSIVASAALLTGLFFISTARIAHADGAGEPETVFFPLASSSEEQSAPVPPSRPWRPDINEDDAEILARLLWSSPLTNEDDKRSLCWLVFNRIDDESLLFGLTVSDVVIKREFTFFDHRAHLSETNLRIARDELARWTAERMGIPVNRPLEAEYLYLRFNGHSVTFLKEK